jgi:hypothetical protein
LSTSGEKTAKEIAATALSLWDMHAEDCKDERSLSVAVARGLVEFGLDGEDAATAAVLVKYALAVHSEGIGAPAVMTTLPIFQAAMEELSTGGWSFD